jgi:hypothetical protein
MIKLTKREVKLPEPGEFMDSNSLNGTLEVLGAYLSDKGLKNELAAIGGEPYCYWDVLFDQLKT